MSTQESHEIRIPRFSFPWIPVIRDSDVQKVIIMRFYFEIKMAPYGLFTALLMWQVDKTSTFSISWTLLDPHLGSLSLLSFSH